MENYNSVNVPRISPYDVSGQFCDLVSSADICLNQNVARTESRVLAPTVSLFLSQESVTSSPIIEIDHFLYSSTDDSEKILQINSTPVQQGSEHIFSQSDSEKLLQINGSPVQQGSEHILSQSSSESWPRVAELRKQERSIDISQSAISQTIPDMANENERLLADLMKAKETIKNLTIDKRNLNKEIKIIKNSKLGKFFSPQLKRLRLRKKVNWKAVDISRALGLRAISNKAFKYVTDVYGLPLPCSSTLNKWMKDFKVIPGIIQNSINLLDIQKMGKEDLYRCTVLCFDEMAVKYQYSYSVSEDRIYKPSKKVQVILARGLFHNWKIPVYFEFDQKVTPEIIFSVMSVLHSIGYDVKALVSDQGPENRSLLSKLKITTSKTHFIHPSTSKKVWIYVDIPHALKNIRNGILDKGLKLESGDIINIKIFEELLKLNKKDFKLCPKLSNLHLYVEGQERQKVNLATQLLSSQVGEALVHYLPCYEEQGKFLIELDKAFNLFNSVREFASNSRNEGYKGTNEQQLSLQFLKTSFKNAKFEGHNSLLPCQNAFIMDCLSLEDMLIELKKELGISYILTTHVNQDCLENYFSKIRGISHDPHPDSIQFIQRVRLLLLGADPSAAISKPNVALEVVEETNALDQNMIYINAINSGFEQSAVTEMLLEENGEQYDYENIVAAPFSNIYDSHSMAYCAGYIAFKAKKFDTSLAVEESNNPELYWIKTLSRGNLCLPSDQLLKFVKDCETHFITFHSGPNNVNTKPKVICNFSNYLCELFPDVNVDIIKIYSKVRTFIRLRKLKQEVSDRKMSIRSKKKKLQYLSTSVAF